MEIDKTRTFARWARKEGVSDQILRQAVGEMRQGLIDADLGSGLVKKRVARRGQGKSGGFRTVVATNRGGRWIFMFGFAKNERADISRNEELALKRLATELPGYSRDDMALARRAGELIEVDDGEER